MTDPYEFRECETCAAKPGTPILCESCLHNRSLILHQEDEIERLQVLVDKYEAAEKDANLPSNARRSISHVDRGLRSMNRFFISSDEVVVNMDRLLVFQGTSQDKPGPRVPKHTLVFDTGLVVRLSPDAGKAFQDAMQQEREDPTPAPERTPLTACLPW